MIFRNSIKHPNDIFKALTTMMDLISIVCKFWMLVWAKFQLTAFKLKDNTKCDLAYCLPFRSPYPASIRNFCLQIPSVIFSIFVRHLIAFEKVNIWINNNAQNDKGLKKILKCFVDLCKGFSSVKWDVVYLFLIFGINLCPFNKLK